MKMVYTIKITRYITQEDIDNIEEYENIEELYTQCEEQVRENLQESYGHEAEITSVKAELVVTTTNAN